MLVMAGEVGGDNNGEAEFKLLEVILICLTGEPIDVAVKITYTRILEHSNDGQYFQDRDILAPTNEIAQESMIISCYYYLEIQIICVHMKMVPLIKRICIMSSS